MTDMMSSVLVFIFIVLMVAAIEHVLNHVRPDDEHHDAFFSRTTREGWIKALVLGAVIAISKYLAPLGGVRSVVALVAVIAVMVYVFLWFLRDVNGWSEWLLFAVMMIPVSFVLASAGAAVAVMLPAFSLMSVVPGILSTAFGGALLASLLFKKHDAAAVGSGWKRFFGIAKWVVMVLTIILIVLQLVWGMGLWPGGDSNLRSSEEVIEVVEPEPEPESESESEWYHFYNGDITRDGLADWNFGPNPLEQLAMEKVSSGKLQLKDIAEKTEDELLALSSVAEVDGELRRRLQHDPALAAGVTAWIDASTGTRFLGTFYEECKGEWASTINLAKVRWMNDPQLFQDNLNAFFQFLNTAQNVELVKVTGGLDDQMYMNPYTFDGVPDVIVMESPDRVGRFLRYTFNIKGVDRTVSYRVDCGYQPTNVAKVMNITPQPNPVKPQKVEPTPAPASTPTTPTPAPVSKSSGGGSKSSGGTSQGGGKSSGGGGSSSGGGGGGRSSGGDPDDDPDPTPITNPKDPTKGTPVGRNDDPGPGPDTNNGLGSEYSSAELPTNSVFIEDDNGDAEEYFDIVEELEEVNEDQSVGGDPNTPSTPTPEPVDIDGDGKAEPTNVDSNADNGTGNGGIDVPTEEHETAVESDLGGSSSTSDDPAGVEWEGPPDA